MSKVHDTRGLYGFSVLKRAPSYLYFEFKGSQYIITRARFMRRGAVHSCWIVSGEQCSDGVCHSAAGKTAMAAWSRFRRQWTGWVPEDGWRKAS